MARILHGTVGDQTSVAGEGAGAVAEVTGVVADPQGGCALHVDKAPDPMVTVEGHVLAAPEHACKKLAWGRADPNRTLGALEHAGEEADPEDAVHFLP